MDVDLIPRHRRNVVVPAAIGDDNERAALLLAATEGQRSVRQLRNVYLPACSLREQYPREADVIARIADDTRRAAALIWADATP